MIEKGRTGGKMELCKLPAEDERLLGQLKEIDESSGEDAVINKIESIRNDYVSGCGNRKEIESANSALIGLAQAKMIDCWFDDRTETYGGLTSRERSYFEDKAEAIRERKAEHRHDYKVSLFSAAIGFALGLISGNMDRIIAAIASLTTAPPTA